MKATDNMMVYADKRDLKFYKGTYCDTKHGIRPITKRYSEAQIYSIAYDQYNKAFLRVMLISPDICPSLTKKTINAHVKQLLDIIGHDCQCMFNYCPEDYFFTLFAGELQCQILN